MAERSDAARSPIAEVGFVGLGRMGLPMARHVVAGGFAEVTAERCTVLAEEAVALDEIDRAGAEERLRNAESDLKDARDDTERAHAEAECASLLEAKLPLPAYDQCIQASHLFNLLDARGVISVTERAAYISRVRALAKGCCQAYLTSIGEL